MTKKYKRERDQNPKTPTPMLSDESLSALGIRTFSKEYKRLLGKVADDDFSASGARYQLLRAQLAMIIQAMPVIEETVHKYKTERAVYAMTALSGHARELTHDLQSLGDQTELVKRIQEEVIRRTLQTLATTIISNVLSAKQSCYQASKNPQVQAKIDAHMKKLQLSLTKLFETADEQSEDYLNKLMAIK